MEYSDSSGNVEQANPSNSANTSNPINSEIVMAERGVLVVQPHETSYLQVLAKPQSRKLLRWSLLCTGAIAALITGVLRWQYALTHEETDKAYVAIDTYAVNSKIPGQVVSVSATENQVVKKGSVLVKLNPSEFEAKVKRATTILEQAQQQVKKATANRDTAKVKINKAIQINGQNDAAVVARRLEVKATKSELKRIFPAFARADIDYARFVKLQSFGFIPLKTLQEAKTKYDDLFKQYNSSTAQVKLAQAKLTTAQQNYLDRQIKLAQQKIEEARKNSQQAQAKLQQKMDLDSKKLLDARASSQQKMQSDSKKRLLSQTKLQQEIEQDSKKLLLLQAKLNKKPDSTQPAANDLSSEKLQAEELKANQKKVEQLKAEQLKAEKLEAEKLKANELSLEKLKADHQKAVQQLEKQFVAKQEQQNKTIARLTEQKTVMAPRFAQSELLLLDYEKSQLYLKAAQTALSQAAAQLKDAEYQLYYTKITAPNNGQINIKRAQTGQKVEPGQTLMSLVPQKPWIAADFKDEQLKKIKPGQLVQIQLKALTDKTFTGKVQSILRPDKTKYNYLHLRPPVKILFDPKTLGNYKSLITPGTPASVKVEI